MADKWVALRAELKVQKTVDMLVDRSAEMWEVLRVGKLAAKKADLWVEKKAAGLVEKRAAQTAVLMA